MLQSEDSLEEILNRIRADDNVAARLLWQEFTPRLLRLARKTLSGRNVRITDAEDAVQSAFLSFWKKLTSGGVTQVTRDDLWQLMATITVRKARRHQARQNAVKRGGGKVIGETSAVGLDGAGIQLDEILACTRAADFDCASEELLLALDPELRTIAVLRLMGYANSEIADSMRISVSSVERKLSLIRRIWRSEFDSGRD